MVARCVDSSQFEAYRASLMGRLSVCPSITISLGRPLSAGAIASRTRAPCGRNVASPRSNSTRSVTMLTTSPRCSLLWNWTASASPAFFSAAVILARNASIAAA